MAVSCCCRIWRNFQAANWSQVQEFCTCRWAKGNQVRCLYQEVSACTQVFKLLGGFLNRACFVSFQMIRCHSSLWAIDTTWDNNMHTVLSVCLMHSHQFVPRFISMEACQLHDEGDGWNIVATTVADWAFSLYATHTVCYDFFSPEFLSSFFMLFFVVVND